MQLIEQGIEIRINRRILFAVNKWGMALLIMLILTVLIYHGLAEVDKNGKCGENIFWNLNNQGELNISGSGEMDNYTYYTAPWYNYLEEIKTVNIAPGITSIGEFAFSNLERITAVSIPDTVSNIRMRAFNGCVSLEGISLPKGLITIGPRAFYGCIHLATIEIPSGVLFIEEGAFEACIELNSVILSSSIIKIGQLAFSDCMNLNNVIIPSGVCSIGGGAFAGNTRLTNIEVSANNKVYTAIEGVLYTKDLKQLVCYPVGKTEESYSILPGVTSICAGAFEGCKHINNVSIPLTTNYIGNRAFLGCIHLSEVTIPGSVNTIQAQTFYQCYALEKVTVLAGTQMINRSAFQMCETLSQITLPSSLTTIEEWAFASCKGLKSMTIPSNVNVIGDHAFYGCDSLTSINIPTYMSYLGNLAFLRCQNLTNITIEDGIQSNKYYHVHDGILYSIDLPVSIGYECDPETPFLFTPAGTALFPDFVLSPNLTIIEREAFSGSNVHYVAIPETVTYIESQAFSSCPNLQFVYFETCDSGNIEIADDAFAQNSNIIFIGNNPIIEEYADAHLMIYYSTIEVEPGNG